MGNQWTASEERERERLIFFVENLKALLGRERMDRKNGRFQEMEKGSRVRKLKK